MRIASAITAIVFMSISGYLYYLTLGFPQAFDIQQKAPGSAYFPQLLIYCLWALCLLLLFRLWQGKEVIRVEWKNGHFLLISAVAMILSVSMIEHVGFFVVMPVYLVFQIRLLFYKRWRHIIILSTAAIVFAYVIFYRVLNLPLPLGILENFK